MASDYIGGSQCTEAVNRRRHRRLHRRRRAVRDNTLNSSSHGSLVGLIPVRSVRNHHRNDIKDFVT